MKIKKQFYYSIFILIIYYAVFIGSSINFSNQSEREYPMTVAAFTIFTLMYIRLFKDKQSMFFLIISMLVLPFMLIIIHDIIYDWSLLDWSLYLCQYILFFIGCVLFVLTINGSLKKSLLIDDDQFVFIKGKNYFSVFLLFIILSASILCSIDQYTGFIRYYNYDNHNESVMADTAYVPVEVPSNEYENYEEGDEESNEEVISTYSLASLWDNPADDEKIIQGLISYCVDTCLSFDGQGCLAYINQYGSSIGIYFGVKTEEENEQLLEYNNEDAKFKLDFSNAIKIKNKINRDPIIMKSVFYTYKHLLYQSLSQKKYYKTDLNNYVDILILSYKDIHTQDDPKSVLISLHGIATLNYDDEDYENLPTMDEIISDDYEREYRNIYYGNGTKVRDEDLFWAYTFWSRRDKENNVKEVYDILVEVQNHYAE